MSSAAQHLVDDPALLSIQISRRLPLPVRSRVGRALTAIGDTVSAATGIAALGAFMAGEEQRALGILTDGSDSQSHLLGEVAVLLDRVDLVPAGAPVTTRARAAWSMGDLSGALRILEDAGRGELAQGRRLRSELRLLDPGFRLPATPSPDAGPTVGTDEPLRVLHLITNSLPHTQSGYALRTHNILTGLRDHGIDSIALTRTGYPVMVGKPWCADEDVIDGIRYRRTLPHQLGSTPEARLEQEVTYALEIAQEFRPHVLHATTDYRNALVAKAVSAATGIPWMFEVRGLMEQTWIAAHRSEETRTEASRSERVQRTIDVEGSLAREAAGVVTLSSTMAEVLVGRGVDRRSITLVPNGVDETLLAERLSPPEARDVLGMELPPNALAVGAVSALVDYEGHDVLLRAVAAMIHDRSAPQELRDSLRVVLVGDGVSAPVLLDLAEELGIGDRLVMPGRVPLASARIWVQALDVVVVPRKDLDVTRTVTPQKPAEALALGRPVVVSNLPALEETIRGPGGTLQGVLVPPEDPEKLAAALINLLQDPQARDELAQRGRDAAYDRTWPAMMRRYEVAYRAVVMNALEETSHGQ